MGTPAKQPIAVAVDQPPETSELPVELEAWASMLWQRFVHLRGYRVLAALLTCHLLSNRERAFLNTEIASKGCRRRLRVLS